MDVDELAREIAEAVEADEIVVRRILAASEAARAERDAKIEKEAIENG